MVDFLLKKAFSDLPSYTPICEVEKACCHWRKMVDNALEVFCSSAHLLIKANSFCLSNTLKIPQGREFEEQPAVPQPAYVFTEYPFGLDDAPATFQVPPVYSEEDPVKRDEPPPPYIHDNDTEVLIENQEN